MSEISKKLRFDTFKRDRFTCQYCGRTPPTVILEVDHVIPVSKGGDNLQENLLTSCFDCNRGKAATPLDQVPKSLNELIIERQRRAEQLRYYNRFLKAERRRKTAEIERIGYYWYNHFKEQKDSWVFGPARTPSIKTFLTHLPEEEILEAIDIAHGRVSPHNGNDDKTFRYFCGVCWKKIKTGVVDGENQTNQT